MNYKELLKILQKNPNEIFLDAQGSKPFEGGILLVEKHAMNFGNGMSFGNHIWFFRTPMEFVDFLPALLFCDIAIQWDDENRNYRYFYEEELETYELASELSKGDSIAIANPKSDFEEEDNEDYAEKYAYYQHLCKINSFDDEEIYDLAGASFGALEVLEVIRISDFINVSEEKFNITVRNTSDKNKIKEMGFTWTQFKILNGYAEMYNEITSKNVDQFLQFLEDCSHDWLELPNN
jgi:alpha-L-fucosidase